MLLCWRCSTCDSNWPRKAEYKTCVRCKADCWGASSIPADEIISEEEAISIKRHIQFDEYCTSRDARLIQVGIDQLSRGEPIRIDELTS